MNLAFIGSVMFVGGLIIASRRLSPDVQLVIGVVMMILALVGIR